MITVFFILLLIVVIGNVLIRLSNKYIPAEVVKEKNPRTGTDTGAVYTAIEKAIEQVTQGKGKVNSIKKI